jgi:2-keto-3-deoxy-L-rhamnonate aldolase RhmA
VAANQTSSIRSEEAMMTDNAANHGTLHAAVAGVDLAVGPSDLSRLLGISGHPDHPRLVAAIDRVREAVKKGAGARLALPLNHAAFPRDAAQLKELGAGYCNCAPTPEARLLRSMQEQAAAQRKLLG